MKKVISFLLFFTILFNLSIVAGAKDNGVKVIVDGKALSENGVIVNNRTLVPMRAICEALGATVKYQKYDDGSQDIIVMKDFYDENGNDGGTASYLFSIGDKIVVKAGYNTEIPISIAPKMINGKTMLPAKDLAKILGFNTTWDANTKTVTISSVKETKDSTATSELSGTDKKAAVQDAEQKAFDNATSGVVVSQDKDVNKIITQSVYINVPPWNEETQVTVTVDDKVIYDKKILKGQGPIEVQIQGKIGEMKTVKVYYNGEFASSMEETF